MSESAAPSAPASAQTTASARASKSSKPASAPASASARAGKRTRSDSITSVSAGESSAGESCDEEPDANFGTRTPVHPSQYAHLLPPDFPPGRCIEAWQYDALRKATQRGDHEAVRKIHEELKRSWWVLDS